ncbi:hypothetical protein POM88_012444 [Heracleum sosnowskyi]|uniref:Conserved oligomeric Golgi complex subunit 5 N-terminal domain-containing protein n=1 Tax=Heracleum sosnowskyi TaxID=360622 RepID=A0AAD8IYQ3_9APIA|nr:hypothetical protein POM88_012444 [Heracleum sosnowskyi]
MASPTTPRQSPLHRLSTFKDRPSSTPPSSPLSSYASDPIFSVFLSPDFNSTSFSSAALSTGSSIARAEKLQHAIRNLETQLRSQVLSHHTHLLSQLSNLHQADSSLSHLRASLSTLQSSLLRLRSEISEPNKVA